jgi:hypothetical protein
VFSFHFLLRTMALLGLVLFLARCAGVAAAVEPPLRGDIVAWTGQAGAGTTFSYSVSIFSNAETPVSATVTFNLDRRLTVLPDHRTDNCVGTRPVVCSFSIYADHPGSATITVRVNPGVCGLPLISSVIMRDDRGFFSADSTAVGLWGRCVLFLPVQRK